MAKWCNNYCCWCSDVEEITDEQYECDLDCNDCDECEEILPSNKFITHNF